ncbi:MAG: hypothetical protein M1150_02345 [Patescibacteria group bacterium]|nr:hypothetical protein [Patescibacteria group bacterium]
MQKEVKKLPKSEYELTITVPVEIIQKEYDYVLTQVAEGIEVSGFRKGKAPKEMVEAKVGKERINQEVLEKILPYSLMEALKEENLVPITDPKIAVSQFELGKDLVYKATITVMPEIELDDYRKVKVTMSEPKKVGEKEIEESVNKLYERWKLIQDQTKKETGITTPEGVATEKAIYTPEGEKISLEKKEPNDEFAKALGAADLVDLKNKVKEEMEIQEKQNVEKEFENSVVEETLKKVKVEVPEALVDEELNRMIINFNHYLSQFGLKFEDYLAREKKTIEQLRQDWRPQAEKDVKIELMLRKIAELEKIDVSPEEVTAQFPSEHKHEDHTPEKKEQEENYVRHALRQAKALGRLKEIATK